MSALDTGAAPRSRTRSPTHPPTQSVIARVTGFGCTPAPVGVRKSSRETASTSLGATCGWGGRHPGVSGDDIHARVNQKRPLGV